MLSLARAPSAQLVPPPHYSAISVSAAVVCILFALLLRWKPLTKLEFLKPWLYLIAGIGFGVAFLTGWINTAMDWCRTSVPYVGSAVPIGCAIVLAYIVLYDLWPKHDSTKTTEISALLLPSFTSAMGGAAGSIMSGAISTVAVTAAGILGKAFGV